MALLVIGHAAFFGGILLAALADNWLTRLRKPGAVSAGVLILVGAAFLLGAAFTHPLALPLGA